MRVHFVLFGSIVLLCGCGDDSESQADAALDTTPDDIVDGSDLEALDTPRDRIGRDATVPTMEYDHACVTDVRVAFDAVPTGGSVMAAWSGNVGDPDSVMPWPRYTSNVANSFGLQNHLQGVARLRAGSFVAFAGSNPHSDIGDLFIGYLPSRSGAGRWGSNLTERPHPLDAAVTVAQPDVTDALALAIGVDPDYWHAGGISTLGDLLAVADERSGASRVAFFDVSDPMAPVLLTPTIDRADDKASAVGIVRVADGRYVVITRNDHHADTYVSRTDRFADGFDSTAYARWDGDAVGGDFTAFYGSETITLVRQCDNQFFLVGFGNTSSSAPVVAGQDNAYLYSVVYPGADLTESPTLTEIARKTVGCGSGRTAACNFDAGASVFVTDAGELVFYGVFHFRVPLVAADDNRNGPMILRLAEF